MSHLEDKARDLAYVNLCYKDTRNPDYYDLYDVGEEVITRGGDCFCANCFTGRDTLALMIIDLIEPLGSVPKRTEGE